MERVFLFDVVNITGLKKRYKIPATNLNEGLFTLFITHRADRDNKKYTVLMNAKCISQYFAIDHIELHL